MHGECEPWKATVIVIFEKLVGTIFALVQYLHLILFGRGRQKKRGLKVEHRQSTGFLLIVSILPTCEKAWHINAFLGIFILWTGTPCITWVLWCFIDLFLVLIVLFLKHFWSILLFLFINCVPSLFTGRTVLWSLAGFLSLTWQVYIFSHSAHLFCTYFVKCSSHFYYFYKQLHIAFCIFAAVAPPIIFKGKSLTWVPSNIALYVSILQTDINLRLIFNWIDILEARKRMLKHFVIELIVFSDWGLIP